MTRYRAEYFEFGEWCIYDTYDSMTAAECALLLEYYDHTRVVVVEDPK